jgi:hypothetical protein
LKTKAEDGTLNQKPSNQIPEKSKNNTPEPKHRMVIMK